jgi:8-oxo-dGTP diphosphatase
VESGETDTQALARECREELGVDIEVLGPAWSTVHEYDDLVIDLTVYHATICAGKPSARQAVEIEWVERPSLGDLCFCPADQPFIAELARG